MCLCKARQQYFKIISLNLLNRLFKKPAEPFSYVCGFTFVHSIHEMAGFVDVSRSLELNTLTAQIQW